MTRVKCIRTGQVIGWCKPVNSHGETVWYAQKSNGNDGYFLSEDDACKWIQYNAEEANGH